MFHITFLYSRRPTTLSPEAGRDAVRWWDVSGCYRFLYTEMPHRNASYCCRTEGRQRRPDEWIWC